MRRSGFRQQSIEEVRTKQATKIALKRYTIKFKPLAGKKASKSGKKVKTQAQLKKELDTVFSIYIRQKYADSHTGTVSCYTCSVVKHWKEIQNGHWIPRNILATRFDEDNCRPQCVGCNMFNKGKPDIFAVNLLTEGIDIKELSERRQLILKLDRHWYIAEIAKYKLLIT